jgi:bacillithiol system protein YtxJ
MHTIPLHTVAEVEQLVEASRRSEKGVVIFKHSTRCAISAMALSRLQRSWTLPEDVLPVYLLDLIQYRDVSNAIAEKFQVAHESPQLLLLKDGEVVYHASHYSINAADVEAHAYA